MSGLGVGCSKYTFGTSSSAPASLDIYNGSKFAMGVVSDAIYSVIARLPPGALRGANNVHLNPALGNGIEAGPSH
jgi:hypothetical protein